MTSYCPSRYLSFISSVTGWPTNQRGNIDVIELSRESIQTLEKKDDYDDPEKMPIHFPTQLAFTYKKGTARPTFTFLSGILQSLTLFGAGPVKNTTLCISVLLHLCLSVFHEKLKSYEYEKHSREVCLCPLEFIPHTDLLILTVITFSVIWVLCYGEVQRKGMLLPR